MRRMTIVLFLCFLAHPSARAQIKSAAQRQAEEDAAIAETHRQEIFLLEREDGHAVQIGNPSFCQRVYGEDFAGISEQGRLLGKAEMLKSIQSSDTKYLTIVVSDIRVRFFQDTAIVQSVWSMRGAQNGRSFSRQKRVMHVYVNGGRGWQMVAAQHTLLPGEGG